MCLGKTHTLSGALAWTACAGAAASLLGFEIPATVVNAGPVHLDLGPVGVIVIGAGIASGAAQLPDTDHPNSAIAHALGPVSQSICRVVSRFFDHRHETHYLISVPFWGLLAAVIARVRLDLLQGPAGWLAGQWPALTPLHEMTVRFGGWQLGLFLVVALLTSWGLRLLSHDLDRALEGAGEVAAGFVAATAAFLWVPLGTWVFAAVVVGVLAHDLGDCTTREGVRLFWPLPWRVSGWYATGSRFERRVVGPALTLALLLAVWVQAVVPVGVAVGPTVDGLLRRVPGRTAVAAH